MSGDKVAIVTGGNKGIGFAIVKGLAKKFDGHVYLTARDVKRGEEAVKALEKESVTVYFHQLDIKSKESTEKLRDFMKEKYGGIDVLINNAGIAFDNDAKEPMEVQAEITIETNYFAVLQTCNILFPILKQGARVVNMSSVVGFLPWIKGQEPAAGELRKKFASSDSTLTVDELTQMMNDFKKATVDKNHYELGWPNSTYAVSKVGLSALSRIQQREFNKKPEMDFVVNFVHPGYVITDLTNGKGQLTPEQGAKSAIYTATLPPKTDLKGKYFWHNCEEVDWVNGPTPTPF